MSGLNGRAAALLGQTTEVTIDRVEIAPQLFITVEQAAAGLPLAVPCLRIIDAQAKRAVFSPLTPQGARNIIATMQQYLDLLTPEGERDGSAGVHE